jgi:hypothetical protein
VPPSRAKKATISGHRDQGRLPARAAGDERSLSKPFRRAILPAVAKDRPCNCYRKSRGSQGSLQEMVVGMASQLAQEKGVRSADPTEGKKLLNSHKEKKTGTILLVEIHPLFLKTHQGDTGESALHRASRRQPERSGSKPDSKGTIDLLLSEVMMTPGQLGTKLAKTLKERRPKMRILLDVRLPRWRTAHSQLRLALRWTSIHGRSFSEQDHRCIAQQDTRTGYRRFRHQKVPTYARRGVRSLNASPTSTLQSKEQPVKIHHHQKV